MLYDREEAHGPMSADRDREQPSAPPPNSSAFHIPTRHMCLCQCCRRTWPCPDADPERWPRIYPLPPK